MKNRKKSKFTNNRNKATLGYEKSYRGKISVTASGFAFVAIEPVAGIPAILNDIFIPTGRLKNALNGDTVKVRILRGKERGKNPSGEILEVLSRGKTDYTGIIRKINKTAFLVPDDPRFNVDIIIPWEQVEKANEGDKAAVKIIKWPVSTARPLGKIIKILGKPGNNEVEIQSILYEKGLAAEFPEHVENDAKNIRDEITHEEIEKRRDFRSVLTFTIDPEDAKDFDDALSFRDLGSGLYEVGVHIADVSHYLIPGTELDKEAYARATSVYLVDRVMPMLPEILSNKVCSLRPDEEKYCFSAVFNLDNNGIISSEWFGKTIIKSSRRFTYDEVQERLDGKSDPVYSATLILLNKIASNLRKERFRKGSIGFDSIEVKFRLDENKNPVGVYFKEMKDSNKMIEDFMLLANKRVAEFVTKKINLQKGVKGADSFVYRIHDLPDKERLKAFAEFVKKFGYSIDVTSPRGVAASMNRLLEKAKGKPEQNLLETIAVRTMSKAIYTTKNIGHYGLGFEYYTHFTSPIRRYPDVLVHRLLSHHLNVKPADFKSPVYNAETLEAICKHSSVMEKKAEEAERDSVKFKQMQYMSKKTGEVMQGIISGVTEWGMYVELTESKCEGLIRLKDIKDDYYAYDEKNYCVRGKRSGKKFQLGDRLKVMVTGVDIMKKQLDLQVEG